MKMTIGHLATLLATAVERGHGEGRSAHEYDPGGCHGVLISR